MQNINMKLPTLKEIEVTFFRKLQEQFTEAVVRYLEEIDTWIMNMRDKDRYRVHDKREVSLSTMFGEVTFKRRMYRDRKCAEYVYLLDQVLSFEGEIGISPQLEQLAVELASRGPSYRESSEQIEKFLGYSALSHETIRERLLAWNEMKAPTPEEKRKASVLFVEVDGIYTHLQGEKRRGKENRIAVVHEGWEHSGKRVSLKHKRHYLHTSKRPFWEGFGDFLTEHYEIDEDTWLVVNGDGAAWINDCTSYFHRCIYTLDRFHVVRDLRRFLKDHPATWKKAKQALDTYDPEALLEVIDPITDEDLPEERREDWGNYKHFLHRHAEHLRDYREQLRNHGIDPTDMRPLGSAESQMRVIAKRTKRGGYSWSVVGVQAMIQTIMARKEGSFYGRTTPKVESTEDGPTFRLRDLFKQSQADTESYLNHTIHYLKTSKQSSPLGMALKGLRG